MTAITVALYLLGAVECFEFLLLDWELGERGLPWVFAGAALWPLVSIVQHAGWAVRAIDERLLK